MMAPTCIYPKHSVDAAIDCSCILYGNDLAKQRGEFPSVHTVMDNCFLLMKKMFRQ